MGVTRLMKIKEKQGVLINFRISEGADVNGFLNEVLGGSTGSWAFEGKNRRPYFLVTYQPNGLC